MLIEERIEYLAKTHFVFRELHANDKSVDAYCLVRAFIALCEYDDVPIEMMDRELKDKYRLPDGIQI